MANYNPNGPGMHDENRPSWRTQDQEREELGERGRWGRERDMRGRHEDDQRHSAERYSGQSGYGAGRYEDRSMGGQRWQGRDDREQGMGLDDRFDRDRGDHAREYNRSFGGRGDYGRGDYGRELGRGDYNPERFGAQGGYAGGRGFEDRFGRGDDYRGGYGGQMYGREMSRQGSMGGQWNQGMRDDYRSGYEREGFGGYGGSQGFRGGSMGAQQGGMDHDLRGRSTHRGKGPQGFTRSDDRIKEIISEALTDDDRIDATHIEVIVKNGEVILTGTVEDRDTKRRAEDLVESLPGVKDVQNQLRVGDRNARGNQGTSGAVGKNETETPMNQGTQTQGGNDKRHRA